MRARGKTLPPISPEWDPPIPEPPAAVLRLKPRTSIKSIVIPEDLSFEERRLSAERQAAYERLITGGSLAVKAEE